jgi:hypothetical protein
VNLFVLIKGNPTKAINIQRGLKQGDTLARFLLVVQELSGAIKSAEECNLFTGFKVREARLLVSHLKYADDAVFLGGNHSG